METVVSSDTEDRGQRKDGSDALSAFLTSISTTVSACGLEEGEEDGPPLPPAPVKPPPTKRKRNEGDTKKEKPKKKTIKENLKAGEDGVPAAKKGSRTQEKKEDREGKEEAWRTRIVDYMAQQNRPYSPQNVFDNLHGVIPKAQVIALMEGLGSTTSPEDPTPSLLMKCYGAQKVFLISQTRFGDCCPQDVESIEAKSKEAQDDVSQLSTAISGIQCRINILKSDQTLPESLKKASGIADSKLNELHEARKAMSSLGDLDAAVASAAAELEETQKANGKIIAEWEKRRRLGQRMIRWFAEILNVSNSDLIEEIGLDVD